MIKLHPHIVLLSLFVSSAHAAQQPTTYPLHDAVMQKKNSINKVRELLHDKTLDINQRDKYEETALMYAAKNGCTETLKALLKDPRIKLNLQDSQGNTALIYAAMEGHIITLQTLLAYKPYNENQEKVNVNMSNDCNCTTLIYASDKGDIVAVKALLKDPTINVNLQDAWGNTALIYASDKGYIVAVKALLKDPKINVNLQDAWGNTALILAVKVGYISIVEALINDERTNTNLQNNDGDTALILATKVGYISIIEALINDKKTNTNLQNNDGDTALILATKNAHREALEILLSAKKIDVNVQNNQGKSALSYLNLFPYDESGFTICLVKKTQVESLEKNHQLLQKYYLQEIFHLTDGYSHTQDIRQYIDILMVNKINAYIKQKKLKNTFYQACCDTYMPKEMKLRLIEGYLRKICPEYCENQSLPWKDKIQSYLSEDTYTYPTFLKMANRAENRFLFKTIPTERTWGRYIEMKAVATQNLASSLVNHGIIQDEKKVFNKPPSVIINLLLGLTTKNVG